MDHNLCSIGIQSSLSKWDVKHITSSPKCPQSNGEAKRAAQTVKGLMKKNVNIQAALCAYRNTPLANGYPPAELVFGRSLNSMGVMPNKSVNLSRLRQFEAGQRKAHAFYYNKRHRAREREPMEVSLVIKIKDGSQLKFGVVIATKGKEIVSSNDSGVLLRRYRFQISKAADILLPTAEDSTVGESQSPEQSNTRQPFEVSPSTHVTSPETMDEDSQSSPTREPDKSTRRTRSGRTIWQPERLDL